MKSARNPRARNPAALINIAPPRGNQRSHLHRNSLDHLITKTPPADHHQTSSSAPKSERSKIGRKVEGRRSPKTFESRFEAEGLWRRSSGLGSPIDRSFPIPAGLRTWRKCPFVISCVVHTWRKYHRDATWKSPCLQPSKLGPRQTVEPPTF